MTPTPKKAEAEAEITGPWLTTQEVADYLKTSVTTIHRWRRSGMLPSYKIGKTRRFRQADVDAAVAGYGSE